MDIDIQKAARLLLRADLEGLSLEQLQSFRDSCEKKIDAILFPKKAFELYQKLELSFARFYCSNKECVNTDNCYIFQTSNNYVQQGHEGFWLPFFFKDSDSIYCSGKFHPDKVKVTSIYHSKDDESGREFFVFHSRNSLFGGTPIDIETKPTFEV